MRAAALLVVLALTIFAYAAFNLLLKLGTAAAFLYLLCAYLGPVQDPQDPQEMEEPPAMPYSLRTRPTKPSIDHGIYQRY